MSSALRGRLLPRLLLLAVGTLIPLVLLEIALRIAPSLLTEIRGGEASAETTILCVGDSHTYGLHVLPSASYPAQLQIALDPTGSSIGVLNYGVPGRNSKALRAELPHYLNATHPDIVLLLVGFNDTWNFDRKQDDLVDETTETTSSTANDANWLASLRIVRLFRLIRFNLDAASARPVIEERNGKMMVIERGKERPAGIGSEAMGIVTGRPLVDQVSASLREMIAMVRAAGATPVLLTYATEQQPVFVDLNRNARVVGRELDVPVVAVDEQFRDPIAKEGYDRLFFHDDHPNGTGNRYMAEIVAKRIVELGLVASSAIAGDRTRPTPNEGAGLTPLESPSLAVASEGESLIFTVTGTPHRDVQIILSTSQTPAMRIGDVELAIGQSDMVTRCLESPNLRGRTNDAGKVELRVGRNFLLAGDGTLYAIAAIFALDGRSSYSSVVATPSIR